MFKADVLEMPFVSSLPKREKSKVEKVWDVLRELAQFESIHGRLLPQTFAAKLLNVSRQRVCELADLGRLETFEVSGVRMVTENSIVAYAQSERKAGRPHGLPTTLRESFRRARLPVK